jgi:hypothetical protein
MRSSSRSSPPPVTAADPRALQSPDLWAKEQPRHADRREVVALNPRLARLHEPPRMLLEEVHRFRFSLRRGFCVREEWRKPLDQAKEAVRLDIQDSDPKLEHGAALRSPRPPPGHDILERRPRLAGDSLRQTLVDPARANGAAPREASLIHWGRP